MQNNLTAGALARFFRLLFFFGLITLLWGCEQKTPKNLPNIVLLTIDTTRADHIGVYGKSNAGTPNLDSFSQTGILYKDAITPIPITLPSHSSMMTGKVPFAHGVRDNGLFKLHSDQLTLAEILKQNGYQTGAAIASFPLTSQFGIDQGFDYFNDHVTQNYEDMYGEKTISKKQLFFDERNAAQVNQALFPWIEDNSDSPFFAWFHYFDPHHPHEPPAPYNQEFFHDLYQGEIAFADESFGKIIKKLKQLKIYENTLIIVTSDHGEGNDEHNESTHSLLIYNTTQHVPLIVKYPQQEHAGQVIESRVGLIDILPTVLSVVGIAIPDDIQGQILPTTEPDDLREIYAETLSPRFSRNWGEQRGIYHGDYKYIFGPQKELYNLHNDPKELKNLIEVEQQKATRMKQQLQDYIDEYQNPDISSSIEVDADTLDTLRGLGYVQSSGAAIEYFEEKLDDSGDPPQKHIDTISTYSHAKNLLFQGKYIDANRYLDALMLTDSDNLAYLELKIQAEIHLGNLESAKELLHKLPDDIYGSIKAEQRLQLLAKISLNQGNVSEAKEHFKNAENLKPTASGQIQLAQIYANEKNFIKQREHLKQAVEIDASLTKAWSDLAINYANDNDLYQAEKHFQKAIQTNPFDPLGHYNYGVFLNSIFDLTAAEKQFIKALELNKQYDKARYALIEIQSHLNQTEKALNNLALLKQLNPNSIYIAQANKFFENDQ